ncbi:Hypothetical protein AKI40_3412 [Enterobacter sp. FY-07]|uniref:hypothetical protein n=1 Tax=Kosakonia oryzendophytica TaxID=1005665 RepID=UPI0007775B6E|nr:hypothetical protein [Kosakonia oryzendophytica]AMO49792.1 Hypothetical protein AKI40_3412 [Enterobacter sp. FY-07]WBT60282.1 hypothetical protein O9K67_11145 [Kosakonia oryzendophytica]
MGCNNERLPGVKESVRALNFESTFRRIGFVLLLSIIGAALMGFFSGGYISSATKMNRTHSLKVEYERVGRLQNEFRMKISPQSLIADTYLFSIGGAFNERFQPGSVWPQPDRMFSQGQTLYLVYNDVAGKRDFSVRVYATPSTAGKAVNTVKVNDEPEVRFWQFIFP